MGTRAHMWVGVDFGDLSSWWVFGGVGFFRSVSAFFLISNTGDSVCYLKVKKTPPLTTKITNKLNSALVQKTDRAVIELRALVCCARSSIALEESVCL